MFFDAGFTDLLIVEDDEADDEDVEEVVDCWSNSMFQLSLGNGS